MRSLSFCFLYSWPFFYADLGFLLLYTIEFVMRMGGHGKDYLPRSLWGFLDLIIIVMAVVTSLGTLLQPNWEGTQECKDSMNGKWVLSLLNDKSTNESVLPKERLYKVYTVWYWLRSVGHFGSRL